MPKIRITPVDHGPAPSRATMAVKLLGMALMTLSLAGLVYLLLQFSAVTPTEPWQWQPRDIRHNFNELLTTEQIQDLLKQKRANWENQNGMTGLPPGYRDAVFNTDTSDPDDEALPAPFGNENDDEETLPPPELPDASTDQRSESKRDERHELKLAEKLTKRPVFDLADETQNLIDFVPMKDASREQCMNQWAAYEGRQSPPNERLALQVLKKLPAPDSAGYDAYRQKIEENAWFFGESQPALDAYRGRGFSIGARGRLFDLYEIEPGNPVILPDGTKVEKYYEGVVAFLGEGQGRNEYAIEPRTVIFQALALPDNLKPYLNASGQLSHTDKLVAEDVMVSLTGAYLRRWVYSREVHPFSTPAKRVLSQDWTPLLLTADLKIIDAKDYALTDEMLQLVRDAYRSDPTFLETEAAYYAMLDQANAPDDAFEASEQIGYFDLSNDKAGPKYRGQGVQIVGMIGDNYAPVILPPNISGLRRVFRALVLDDTADLNTPKRYVVDMIEPPTGLEPRALVDFKARYYRNVHEAQDTRSVVRPLLIVKQVRGYSRETEGDDWFYAVTGVVVVVLLIGILSFFIFSERKERTRFEQSTLEMSQKRMKKTGGLKLKPLPDAKDAEPKPDEPADKPDADEK